jgi:2-polyprenyl-3-methyl-5-hydroxy-6-metoxy-1,4-benzoquinol methylase
MKYLYVLIFFVLLCVASFLGYNYILRKYFVVNDTIVYDTFLKHFIQVVSKDNFFMNYGLWDDEHNDLFTANTHLANFIFEKTNKLLVPNKNVSILDVGCGYGVQDLTWSKMLSDESKIIAVDISETQIAYANEKRKQQNISDTKLCYETCDAMKLTDKYSAEQFDAVISLESAFHYSDRPKFFKNVHSIIKKDGVFAISDIMLNTGNGLFNNLFLKIFSDFLHIPKQNLVGVIEWKQQLQKAGFDIVEYNDITSQTFAPYYKHFIYTYCKNKGLPDCFASVLNNIFQNTQPFAYSVAMLTQSQRLLGRHIE